MDAFVKNMFAIFTISKQPIQKQILVKHTIVEKQYICYYLYRIICKYEKLFENVVSYKRIRNIYNMLRIPKEKERLCYPMAQKMVNNDEALNLIIKSMLDIFKDVNKIMSKK